MGTFKEITGNPIQGLLAVLAIGAGGVLLATPYYPFAMLPGIVLLLLLWLGRAPLTGLCLILALVPLQSFRTLSDAYQFLTISKVLGLVVAAAVALHLVFGKIPMGRLKSNLWPILLLLLFINLVSALFSHYPGTSIDTIRKLVTAIMVFTMTLVLVSPDAFRRSIPQVICLSTFLGAFLSIVGFVFGIHIFVASASTGVLKRGLGAAGDPNFFSAMLIFSLPILSHFFFSARRPLHRCGLLLMFIANVCGVVLTYSRGGALVMAAVLVLLLFEHAGKFRLKLLGPVLMALLLGIGAIFLAVPGSYWERQKSITHVATDTSLSRRVTYLLVARDAFLSRWGIGTGPGTFRDIFAASTYARLFDKKGGNTRRAAHNAYLEVAVGTGLPGITAFLGTILLALWNFGSAQRRYRGRGMEESAMLVRAYRISFLSFLFSFCVLSLTYHKYFWILLALSSIAARTAAGVPEGAKGEGEYRV